MPVAQTVRNEIIEVINAFIGKGQMMDDVTHMGLAKRAKALTKEAGTAYEGYLVLGELQSVCSNPKSLEEYFENALRLSKPQGLIGETALMYITALMHAAEFCKAKSVSDKYWDQLIEADAGRQALNLISTGQFLKLESLMEVIDSSKILIGYENSFPIKDVRPCIERAKRDELEEDVLCEIFECAYQVSRQRGRISSHERIHCLKDGSVSIHQRTNCSIDEAIDITFEIADKISSNYESKYWKFLTIGCESINACNS